MTIMRRRRRSLHDDGHQETMITNGCSTIMRFVILILLLLALQDVTCLAASFQPVPRGTRSTITTRTKMRPLLWTSSRTPTTPTRILNARTLLSLTPTDDRDNQEDDDNAAATNDNSLIDGPEKSLMTNYISEFLLREAAAAQQQQQQEESPMSFSTTSAAEQSATTESNNDDDYSHLVAIPMDNCHELLLELESIQRAILYHCPVLVHACIPQAITRLPLLYVNCAGRGAPSSLSSSSSTTTTKRLGDMVQEVIQKHGLLLLSKQNSTCAEKTKQQHVNGKTVKKEYNNGHVVDDDELLPHDFINRGKNENNDDGKQQITIQQQQPLMLNFSTLEVDGNTNQVLQTVAKETDASTRLLQQMVYDLQNLIQQQEPTWKTMLPPDPHHSRHDQSTTTTSDTAASTDHQHHHVAASFRPRIPFMRLPHDWDVIIQQQYKREKQQQQQQQQQQNQDSTNRFNSDNVNDNDDDDNDQVFLTSDQGGNGISPIFWCQWWHDEFPESRMREIAIYRRQKQQHQLQPNAAAAAAVTGLNEQTFYMPEKSIPLPMGNDALTKQEIKFQDYQEQRMLEAEALQAQEQQQSDDDDDDDDYNDIIIQQEKQQQDENDPLFIKTRNRLESIYQQSSSSWDDSNMMPPIKDNAQELDETIINVDKSSPLSVTRPTNLKPTSGDDRENDSSSNSILDEWTLERIRRTVASRAKVQTEKELARKKDNLPPIAENNVFTKYKEGTLVPEQDQTNKRDIVATRELPPFPSREHCLGFWRVLKSPTGFDVEQDENDPTRSDNLVLCVDGTIAGGPILDQETRQKASGGTWRLSATSIHDATLRIRLVIPPKKERILVMQGKLTRLSSSLSGSSFSMPSSTFSIPALEEKMAKANQESEMLTCQGEVWLEDAVTGYDRKDVGTFALMKLETSSDPKSYTITIPRPVRNQD